jgi:hypothetical protein
LHFSLDKPGKDYYILWLSAIWPLQVEVVAQDDQRSQEEIIMAAKKPAKKKKR